MVRPQSRRLARNKVGKKSRVKQLVEMPRTLLGQNFDFQTFLMRARIRLYLVYTLAKFWTWADVIKFTLFAKKIREVIESSI